MTFPCSVQSVILRVRGEFTLRVEHYLPACRGILCSLFPISFAVAVRPGSVHLAIGVVSRRTEDFDA